MTGLVSSPSTPPLSGEAAIANDGWFPNLELSKLQDLVRVDAGVTAKRVRSAAIDAILAVNRDLTIWKAAQVLAGHASLAAVPAPQVDDRSAKLALYERAVASLMAADLAGRLRDIGTTAAGHDRADELEDVTCEHRRNAVWAIQDLQDAPRATVELI